ncbi:MAG: hypothetical protein WA820_25665 [Bradyrhizobium sp.]|jgi:hypothetical protein
MSDDGDVFEESEDDGVRDFDRLSDILFRHVSTFADEEGVADEMLVRLLLRLSLSVRMMTYAMSVAKPSGGGLRLDLDRFRRDADDLIRGMKKDADQFIARAKETIAAAEQGDDET